MPHQPLPPREAPQLRPHPRPLLALDYGARRTGVAATDALGLLAHARPAILAPSIERVIEEVASLVERDDVSEVVVGLPLTLAGGDSDQTREARAFAARLRKRLAVPVTEWDERLSTLSASRHVRGARQRRSGELDSTAAAIVLQTVLDARRRLGAS